MSLDGQDQEQEGNGGLKERILERLKESGSRILGRPSRSVGPRVRVRSPDVGRGHGFRLWPFGPR